MNRVESLLRAAVRDEAAEAGPESVPSFEEAGLPEPQRPLLRSGLSRGPLAPTLAAAAVIAVVALAVTVSSVLPGSGHAAGSRTGARIASAVAADEVPPYTVALTATGTPAVAHPLTIRVGSSRDGSALATVEPPPGFGTFSLVDGTANPTTFLVGAQAWRPTRSGGNPANPANSAQPVTLFWLRYDPATRTVRLSPLPLSPLAATGLTSVSVSPDGSRLAVAYGEPGDTAPVVRSWITVYSLPGGASHTWSVPGSFKGAPGQRQTTNFISALSWAADDRTLAFPLAGQRSGVYLLDTEDTGSTDLLTAGRLAVPIARWVADGDLVCADAPRLTANGAEMVCGAVELPPGWSFEAKGWPTGPVTQGFAEFSVRTGKLVAFLGAVRGPWVFKEPNGYLEWVFPTLLWASSDAQVTIGLTDGHAVVVRDGRTQRSPMPDSIVNPLSPNIPGIAW